MAEQNLYDILGVEKSADEATIKSAFRKKVKTCHPDYAPGKEEQYRELVHAYDVLSDAAKRTRYDSLGHDFYTSMNNTSASASKTETDEKIEKIMAAIYKIDAELNRPGKLKDKFLAALKSCNELVSKPIVSVPVIIWSSCNSYSVLDPAYNGWEHLGVTVIAGAVSYGALRASPLGMAIGGQAGKLILGNTVKLANVFTKASTEAKKLMIAGSVVIGGIGGTIYGGIKTYDLIHAEGIEIIQHPEKIERYGLELKKELRL